MVDEIHGYIGHVIVAEKSLTTQIFGFHYPASFNNSYYFSS